MKFFYGVLAAVILFFGESNAFAFKADHFKGAYAVLGEHKTAPKYFVCDVDTLANIWAKYADGPLPPEYEEIRNEPSILAAFTFRDGLFFTLERSALIGELALAVPGKGNDTLQLKRKPDGHYELGVRISNVVNFYDLGPREDL